MTAIESLWGDEFSVPVNDTERLLDKIKSPKKTSTRSGVSSKMSIEDKMAVIESNVTAILGKHKEDTVVIRNVDDLHDYIDHAIENGVLAVDTETNNSLDVMTCLIMGLCLYTSGQKQAYVPVNHIDRLTGERLANQLTENDIKNELSRVTSGVDLIFHNASFDIRVIENTCGVSLPYAWDTMIASQILNENEEGKLKTQYMLHIDPNHGKYDIENLFQKEQYAIFDPELFALYSATDAMMTFRLYEYQKKEFEKPGNERIYALFKDVEMPVLGAVINMEKRGVEVDLEYAQRLSVKYHKILDEYDIPIQRELEALRDKVEEWKTSEDGMSMIGNKRKCDQLTDPINIESPVQLAIIVYDILKLPVVNHKKPRSVDKNTIPLLLEENDVPLLDYYLERKAFKTLVNNFIDKMPEFVSEKDGRVHCSFNQVGAATGRFSCSSPNLQQIPSKNHEIRLMFKARDGYVLAGGDFSQQEPRLLANYSQDEYMIDAYKNNRDLYATIASRVYHNDYKDNLEFDPDTGRRNDKGAKRRSSCKGLLLGIMYGMSVQGIAGRLECSVKEAQSILDGFYNGFPKVRKWTDETIANAKKTGYVEDWYGRRRRLDDIVLPDYSLRFADGKHTTFNPIIGCDRREIDPKTESKYREKLSSTKNFKEVSGIIKEARSKGILIQPNDRLIARAERQCVNARIQGGAATMTKVAMIKIDRDKELNDLGFRMLIGVHDELIGECPKENADAVAERLSYLMRTCIEDYCNVPFKCDADVSERWYYNVYKTELQDEMSAMMKDGKTKEDAVEALCEEHIESTREFILGCLE